MKLDIDAYDYLVSEGLLRGTVDGDLTLYNYTSKCQNGRHWIEETKRARGLVLSSSGEVIALPFPKFFNLGEMPESCIENLPAGLPELTEKYDGSLIITFWDGAKWRAITRGSWNSKQAECVQKKLDLSPPGWRKALTFLWELVAPWNRIVVPYEQEQMILLAAINRHTGEEVNPPEVRDSAKAWGYKAAKCLGHCGIGTIDLSGRQDGEGYVARWPGGFRVKLKFDHYCELHRIIAGTSERRIWEVLVTGDEWTLHADLPPEFCEWAERTKRTLIERFESRHLTVQNVMCATPKYEIRKQYADHFLDVVGGPDWLTACLFMFLDGKNYDDVIWKSIKP